MDIPVVYKENISVRAKVFRPFSAEYRVPIQVRLSAILPILAYPLGPSENPALVT